MFARVSRELASSKPVLTGDPHQTIIYDGFIKITIAIVRLFSQDTVVVRGMVPDSSGGCRKPSTCRVSLALSSPGTPLNFQILSPELRVTITTRPAYVAE